MSESVTPRVTLAEVVGTETLCKIGEICTLVTNYNFSSLWYIEPSTSTSCSASDPAIYSTVLLSDNDKIAILNHKQVYCSGFTFPMKFGRNYCLHRANEYKWCNIPSVKMLLIIYTAYCLVGIIQINVESISYHFTMLYLRIGKMPKVWNVMHYCIMKVVRLTRLLQLKL